MMNQPRPILLVDDSTEDYEATTRSLRKVGLTNPIFHCRDGEEALDFLYQRGGFAGPDRAPRPTIILLDLNLPVTDGHGVLVTIKGDASLQAIPVVVLTGSIDERDVERCYREGANSYIRKPVDPPDLIRTAQRLKEYWFELAILPDAE